MKRRVQLQGYIIRYPECIMEEVLPTIKLLRGKVNCSILDMESISQNLDADFLVIPGGSCDLAVTHKKLHGLIQKVHTKNGVLAGICNGALVLASAGVLKGQRCTHTAHPKYAPAEEFKELLEVANRVFQESVYVDEDVVVSNNIITAKPSAADSFAQVVLDQLEKASSKISIRKLERNEADILALQEVLEAAPRYAFNISGGLPSKNDAKDALEALPPKMGFEDKFVFGIYLNEELIGCADVIRGFPDRKTAMLGLLLLSEEKQGKGLGRAAYERVEQAIKSWAGIEKIRISVVRSNGDVAAFWQKMGFVDIGERKPFENRKVVSECLIFEKSIVSQKPRQTMYLDLEKRPIKAAFQCRTVCADDSEMLGILMERAFRGTVDDDGETSEQFIQETKATLSGKYGPLVQEASFLIEHDSRIVATSIVTLWKEKPLLAFSATDPEFQGKGMARFLILKSINALIDLKYKKLELGVTRANIGAVSLYESLGFRVQNAQL